MVRETRDVRVLHVSFNNAITARRVVLGRGAGLQGGNYAVQVFDYYGFSNYSRIFLSIYTRDPSQRLKAYRSSEFT